MICPYCGRRNPAGATFCLRCRQRLPLAGRLSRRTKYAEPAGGGGLGALAIAAALLAGFVFIGGAVAIYLSQPQVSATLPPLAVASETPTLPPFVQPTASPSASPIPTASATFATFTPSGSLLPTPTGTFFPTIPPPTDPGPIKTPRPTCNANGNPPGCRPVNTSTPRPTNNTPPPTDPGPAAPVARFSCEQDGTNKTIHCNSGDSSGQINSYAWVADDGGGTSDQPNPSFSFNSYGQKTVTLTVSGPGGADSKTKQITVSEPGPTPCQVDCPTNSPPPTLPTEAPTASPTLSPVVYSGSVEAIAYVLGVVSVLSVINTATSRRRRP